MLSLILLFAGVASADTVQRSADGPATQQSADAAAIVVHRQPGVPLVALRLSVLAYDPPGYAGAGHMIQHLLYPGLEERAARVGGSVQIQRTSDAVVYTATGPASELTFLSELLISTLEPPQPRMDGILRAERELREERLAEWETAPAHTRSSLRTRIFPQDLSAAGTDRAATRFTSESIPEIWQQMYRPERVSVVAVGDVFMADVQRAFAELPDASQPRPLGIERDSVVLVSLAPPQTTRGWFGSAYLTTDLEPAAVTVATRLLGDLLRARVPSAQVDAEHWWTHHGQAIALIVAVPEPEIDLARSSLFTVISGLLRNIDEALVTDAATAIRHEMLFYSRTPDRMANVIGQFVDRDGFPDATERFYAALDEVAEDDVREVLETILDRPPARIELPPQELETRSR